MPTTFTEGDMFADPTLKAFCFGCTTQGNLDAGVAVAFKKRFDGLEEEYQTRCRDQRLALGDTFLFTSGDTFVLPLALQTHWKSRAKLAALERAMARAIELCSQVGAARLGVPRIGTGLGGLEWLRVKSVLTKLGATTAVELLVFEKFVRGKVVGEPEAELD